MEQICVEVDKMDRETGGLPRPSAAVFRLVPMSTVQGGVSTVAATLPFHVTVVRSFDPSVTEIGCADMTT